MTDERRFSTEYDAVVDRQGYVYGSMNDRDPDGYIPGSTAEHIEAVKRYLQFWSGRRFATVGIVVMLATLATLVTVMVTKEHMDWRFILPAAGALITLAGFILHFKRLRTWYRGDRD